MKKGIEVVMLTGGTFKKAMREPGRNEPCPCGSGEKFKRCCLDKGYAAITLKVIAASVKNMEAKK